LEGEEAEDPTTTVLGTLLVRHLYARVLFDFGATHSFVNHEFTKKLAIKPNEMNIQLYMTTSLGSIYHTGIIVENCPINVVRRILSTDLVQLEKQG